MSNIFTDLDMAGVFVAVLGDNESFTYTTRRGAAVAIRGIFENPAELVDTGTAPAGEIQRQAKLSVAEADLPAGYGQGDSISRGSESWSVRAPLPDGNGMVDLILERVSS